MKSGDTGPVSTTNPPAVLITTPESTDSLLTRVPRLLAELQAIVLDEIHLLDGGRRATSCAVSCAASNTSAAITSSRVGTPPRPCNASLSSPPCPTRTASPPAT